MTPPPTDARSRILRAGQMLIGQRDGATTMAELLREAGVNRRTFYENFKSKDELVLAMVDAAAATLQAGLEAAVTASRNAPSAVAAYIDHMLGIGWDERRAHDGRAFLSHEVGLTTDAATALERAYARHRAVLRDVIAAGLAAGTLPKADPERDAFAIHAVLVRHLEVRVRLGGQLDFATTRDGLVELFLIGMGAGRALSRLRAATRA
jgi:AcrR family transcriptional regulator